jgi:hypothetical protein
MKNTSVTTTGKTAVADAAPAASIEPDAMHRMIETAAYYQAEKRGFAAGHEQDDWLIAEQEISRMLAV